MRRLVRYDSEAVLHQQVVDYLKTRYPRVLFRTDFAAGAKMSIYQARLHKALQRGRAWPDLFIAEPSLYYSTEGSVEEYSGLFIELKKDGTRIYTKDGDLVANEHIREQAAVLELLRQRGYKAEFAVGFNETRSLIDQYLGAVQETSEVESPF